MKNTLFLAHSIDILVRLLTVNMKNFLTPKLHSSNSIESATPSSGTSPLASYKEVSHPGFKAVSLVRILLRGPPPTPSEGWGEEYVSPSSEVQKRSFRVLKRRPSRCRYFTMIVSGIFLVAVAVLNQLHIVCRQFIRFVLLFQGHVAYRNLTLSA